MDEKARMGRMEAEEKGNRNTGRKRHTTHHPIPVHEGCAASAGKMPKGTAACKAETAAQVNLQSKRHLTRKNCPKTRQHIRRWRSISSRSAIPITRSTASSPS